MGRPEEADTLRNGGYACRDVVEWRKRSGVCRRGGLEREGEFCDRVMEEGKEREEIAADEGGVGRSGIWNAIVAAEGVVAGVEDEGESEEGGLAARHNRRVMRDEGGRDRAGVT